MTIVALDRNARRQFSEDIFTFLSTSCSFSSTEKEDERRRECERESVREREGARVCESVCVYERECVCEGDRKR